MFLPSSALISTNFLLLVSSACYHSIWTKHSCHIIIKYPCRFNTFHCFFCDFKILPIAKSHHGATDLCYSMNYFEGTHSNTLYYPFWLFYFTFCLSKPKSVHSVHCSRYYNLAYV